MIRYIITTHPGRCEANLSRIGKWGGMKYPSIAAARQAARMDADGKLFEVTQQVVRRPILR